MATIQATATQQELEGALDEMEVIRKQNSNLKRELSDSKSQYEVLDGVARKAEEEVTLMKNELTEVK